MTENTRARMLPHEQSPDGAFRSYLHWDVAPIVDWNCFTTALALRHGARFLSPAAREKALTFLLRCRHSDGAFGFWPPGGQPSLIRDILPSDCDDSAITAIELARGGRWVRRDLRQLVLDVLVRRRLLHFDAPAPPWLRRGVFLTWLSPDSRNPLVDCCANVNVAALLAFADMTHVPGYAAVCEMVEAGLIWAGDDKARARALTPYYPEPVELRYALEHAVRCGAHALEESSRRIRRAPWAHLDPRPDAPLCGSAYGGVFWTAPVVQFMRASPRRPRAAVGSVLQV